MTIRQTSFRILVALATVLVFVTSSPLYAAVSVEKLSASVVYLHVAVDNRVFYGTGFFVHSVNHLYLITAAHVARELNSGAQGTILAPGGKPFNFALTELLGESSDALKWAFSKAGDVAILRLDPQSNEMRARLADHFMPTSWIENAKEAPLRALTITVLGFPLQLGVSPVYFSPISKETKAASGLLELPQPELNSTGVYFVTQDPSIGGFSGAPVFDTRLPYSPENSGLILQDGLPRIVGVVSGTLSDSTGGKLGVIVPAFIIQDVIREELAAPR